jgi:hypothetical protein
MLAAADINSGRFRVDDIQRLPIHLLPGRPLLWAGSFFFVTISPISITDNGLGPVPIRK